MNLTSIEWTDFSANPIKYRDAAGKVVWACVHASPGCQHCYAETLAKRYGKGGPFTVPTTAKVTPFLDEREVHRMLTAKWIGGQAVAGSRCFVGDMTDIFGPWVPDELLDQLFAVFALRPDVTWQLLTKRPERMHAWFHRPSPIYGDASDFVAVAMEALRPTNGGIRLFRWPLPNVWLGVSAEDQQRADDRIPHLLQTPAAVRFVSAEPLIGPIDFDSTSPGDPCQSNYLTGIAGERIYDGEKCALDWVIVGGESGPKARPCHVDWVRSIVEQCESAGVPAFVKQLGSHPQEPPPGAPHPWDRFVIVWRKVLRSRKGSDPSEWPADLRVREFPRVEVPA